MPERLRKYLPALLIGAALALVYLTFFAVRETEFVLVTQFGRPIRTITQAGLNLKWPFQSAPASQTTVLAVGVAVTATGIALPLTSRPGAPLPEKEMAGTVHVAPESLETKMDTLIEVESGSLMV